MVIYYDYKLFYTVKQIVEGVPYKSTTLPPLATGMEVDLPSIFYYFYFSLGTTNNVNINFH